MLLVKGGPAVLSYDAAAQGKPEGSYYVGIPLK